MLNVGKEIGAFIRYIKIYNIIYIKYKILYMLYIKIYNIVVNFYNKKNAIDVGTIIRTRKIDRYIMRIYVFTEANLALEIALCLHRCK